MPSEVEKLRALLAEARDLVAANRLVLGEYSGVREVQHIEARIDAALAEPVGDALEWQTAITKALSESQERLAAELKEARAELASWRGNFDGPLAFVRDHVEKAFKRGAEAMRERAARVVEDADDGVPLQSLADGGIRALPLPEDK